jgi:CelD/BcsL family acetyltransferase involved in cellulose biosynthesis
MHTPLRTEPAVDVVVATSLAALDEHADAWDRLALSSPERLPMLSHAWTAAFLETRGKDRPWWCLFAYRGTELVGVMPVTRTRGWTGVGLRGPTDQRHTLRTPLLAPAHAPQALRALIGKSRELDPHAWIRFHGARDCSPLLQALPALDRDMRVLRPVTARGLLVDTTGSFDDFAAALNKSFKKSLRSARNRAARDHGLTFDVVSGPEAAQPELLEHFLRVERSSWKAASGTTVACNAAEVAFYSALSRRLARRGWLEWHLALVHDVPVAVNFMVRFGASLLLPKGVYDDKYAKYGLGNLLFWEAVSRSYADDTCEELNVLTDIPWMHVWHMQDARYHDIIVGSRGPVSTVCSLLEAWEPRRRAADYLRNHPELEERVRRATRRFGGKGRARLEA